MSCKDVHSCDVDSILPKHHAVDVTDRDIVIVLVSDVTKGMQPIACFR